MDTPTPPVRYLGETDISIAAERLADGIDPGLKDVHAEGAAKVYAAALRIMARRARQKAAVEAMMREATCALTPAEQAGEESGEAPPRRRYGRRRVARPDAILRDLLTSPEAMLMLSLLSGAVALATRLASWNVPGALGRTSLDERPNVQAIRLLNYLRHKTQGDPITRGGVRVGHEGPPATYPAPKADRLPPELRAWANVLTPAEAAGWLSREDLVAHLEEIREAGAEVLAVYGRAFDRLGWPVGGVYAGPSMGLPLAPDPGDEPPPAAPAPAPLPPLAPPGRGRR